jgi:hypothetical protein
MAPAPPAAEGKLLLSLLAVGLSVAADAAL